MKIGYGAPERTEEIMAFYDHMCVVLNDAAFLPNGNKGGFPPRAMVEDAVAKQEILIGEEDGRIVAAVIANADREPAYDTTHWQIEAAESEFWVIHALRVLPEYSGRGYARRMVERTIEMARARGKKALRLDCIVGNEVPERMYQSIGFVCVDTVKITYADIGTSDFHMYELVL